MTSCHTPTPFLHLIKSYRPPTPKAKTKTTRRKVGAKTNATTSSPAAAKKKPVERQPSPTPSPSPSPSPPQHTSPLPATAQPTRTTLPHSSYKKIVEQSAELYLWDAENETFLPQAQVVASLVHRPGSSFEYWMVASNDSGDLFAHRVSSEMNQRWSHKMQSLTWNQIEDDGSGYSWLFRFLNQEQFSAFLEAFTQCLWESLHQTPWAKAKVGNCLMGQLTNTADIMTGR